MQITRQVDSEGNKLSTNSGKYHSYWLNMMYPRLKLARNLLKDDGVIFISIDDNEVANLRKLMDEIFGEDNFVTEFIWQKKKGRDNDSKYVATEYKYLLMFTKNKSKLPSLFQSFDAEYEKRYLEEDEFGKYFWDTFKRKSGKQYYPIICPDGTILQFDENGNPLSWLHSEARFYEDLKNNEIKFEKNNSSWSIFFKQRKPEGKTTRRLLTNYGTTSNGSSEILELFKKDLFENLKPINLLTLIVEIGVKQNDLILDFFSDSATTAHVVMKPNSEDGRNRKFICAQLPETTDEKSEAYKAGYKNICEIGKERIRRAGDNIRHSRENENLSLLDPRIEHEDDTDKLDIGSKVLKLDSSNIKTWDSDFEDLEQNLLSSVDNRVANYRQYGDDGVALQGKYSQWLEEEYKEVIKQRKFRTLFESIKDIDTEVSKIHNGYFSSDKKGVLKDSTGNSADDEDTFTLIMKDKEKLLSFESPLRFIFSHSALKEGWDNPNVFQICTLNETNSIIKKRQEIGRGLRICVNQDGQRVYGYPTNTITVMANESYEDFTKGLQEEIEKEEGIKFGVVAVHEFANITLKNEAGKIEYFGAKRSESAKIKCGQKHFESIKTKVEFVQSSRFSNLQEAYF